MNDHKHPNAIQRAKIRGYFLLYDIHIDPLIN